MILMKNSQVEIALYKLIEELNYFLLTDIAKNMKPNKSGYNFDTRKGVEEYCKQNIYDFLEVIFFCY